MSDYSVVEVDGTKTLGVFDNYCDARKLYGELAESNQAFARHALDLLCMHPCGCLYRAGFIRSRMSRGVHFDMDYEWRHTHWRRVQACRRHVDDEAWAMYGHDDSALEAEAQRLALGKAPLI